MPTLASLAPYLKPLQQRITNPYATMGGRQGSILAAGNEAVDDSPAGQVGDMGAGAQFDRALAAESAAGRSADLTNWLDTQAADRVPAMFERDDPEGAARVRAMQKASLRPETPARPNLDALERILQFRSPQAAAGRQQALQEKITGDVAGETASTGARQRAEYDWFNSIPAQMMRRTGEDEALAQTRRQKNLELELAGDPRAKALRAEERQGALAVANARNPDAWRMQQMQTRQQGPQGPTTPVEASGGVALTPIGEVRYPDGTVGVKWSNGAVYEKGFDPNTVPPEEW